MSIIGNGIFAGGGSATLITKSITANGTYNASADNADGYSSVTVAVGEYDMTVTADQVKVLVDVYTDDKSINLGFTQSVANGCKIDWGDGNFEQSNSYVNRYDSYARSAYPHTYLTSGKKLITITANSGNIILWGDGASGAILINFTNTNSPGIANFAKYWLGMIKQVAVGDNVILRNQAFRGIPGFTCNRYMDATNPATGVAETTNTAIEAVVYGDIVIPDTITTIRASTFQSTTCNRLVIPASVTAIKESAFYNAGIHIYDLTAITNLTEGQFPITLESTNAFSGTHADSVFLFYSQTICDAAKVATYWSTYASRMHYVGE